MKIGSTKPNAGHGFWRRSVARPKCLGRSLLVARSIVNHQAFCKKTDQRKELWYKYVWTTVAFHNIFDRAPGVHDRIVYFQP